MVVTVALFAFGPLILLCLVLTGVVGIQGLRRKLVSPRLLSLLRMLLWVLWLSGCTVAVVEWSGYHDWMHLFWAMEGPLLGIFLCSGVLLSARTRSGALPFFAMMLGLALLPLALEIVLPHPLPDGRNTGEPLRRLFELARWSLGGAVPECLAPHTNEQIARGLGHLPREVTVPMGTMLLAARLYVGFCAIALVGRVLRSQRARLVLFLAGPGILLLCWKFLEPNFDSDLWSSDPALMRGYGAWLLAAGFAAGVSGAVRHFDRRRVAESQRAVQAH